ncbi:Ig-like domain-containing domain [Saccharicrinis sp. FJH2]|uniref:Ig-like domain-containing domain n=1 Tax=Saccharicrinis sp. FJH65 TaxID=3344659 RepID=UPI0035F37E05
MQKLIHIFFVLLAVVLFHACANPGMPSGGPKDVDPPLLIKSKPEQNQKNYTDPKIQLYFDEIVVLKDTRKNFIVSPPLEEEPIINALAKKISIDLNNELQPNTTYTLYFGSAIVDNNEGNPLENFTFSFSTGEVIDSMMMSGRVIRAKDLEPIANIIVGIYKDTSDSAFIKNVPLRIAQTNSKGEFSVKNIAPGKYRIYALNEPIKNYRYDAGEEIAFLDTIYETYFDTIQLSDTVWVDSVTVDTIMYRDTLIYGPENILLQTFEEFHLVQNLRKKERSFPYQFLFSFSSPIQEDPKLHIDGTPDNYGGIFSEYSTTRDTIYYWLTDSNLYKLDTLMVELQYQKTDSLEQLFWQQDTIQMIYREPKSGGRKGRGKNKPDEPKTALLKINHNISATMNLKGRIMFEFEEPINRFNKDEVHLYLKADTLEKPLNFTLDQSDLFPRKFFLDYNWAEGESYTLSIDSAAIENIYGIHSDKFKSSFTIRKLDQYGNVKFNLTKPDYPGVLYMLDASGKILRSQPFSASDNTVSFRLILPGKYYFSLFFDKNRNGEWDTGNLLEHIQPEPVRYFSKQIEVKAYRDYEEDWDTEKLLLWKQKPEALQGKEEKR